MFKYFKSDLKAVLERDPAARNWLEVVLTYSGFHALRWHRVAHFFHKHKMKFIARCISQFSRFLHGIEIHPGAVIGKGMFIDHGTGIVIGETTEIGDNVVIYQGVTLGGTGKDTGKRHPTIKDNVMLCAGCKVLGPITIGENCKIGAQSVVLKDVPPNCTVVGVPGKIVKMDGHPVADMDQTSLIDPVMDELSELKNRVKQLEKMLNIQYEEKPIIVDCCCDVAESKQEQEPVATNKKRKMINYFDDYAELGEELEDDCECPSVEILSDDVDEEDHE